MVALGRLPEEPRVLAGAECRKRDGESMSPLRARSSSWASVLLGIVTLVSCLPRFRRPTLVRPARALPRCARPSPLAAARPWTEAPAAVSWRRFQPLLEDLGARLQRLFGDDGQRSPGSPRGGRIGADPVRLPSGAGDVGGRPGSSAGIVLSIGLTVTGRNVSPVAALIVATAFAAIGIVGRDRSLTRAVEARRDRAQSEFPTVVDMVCLAVTAGESLRGALELVATAGSGPLASELRMALRIARGGVPLAEALQARAGAVRPAGVRPVRLGRHRRAGAGPAAGRGAARDGVRRA